MSLNPYIRTYSGKRFYILKPTTSQIDIQDITHGLSMLCRFTGHTKVFLSVAQHSCMVSDLLPDTLKLTGLLHDASENFLQDLNAPLKSILPQYKQIEEKVEKVIAKKFGLTFPFPPQVKEADLTMLASEMKWFVNSGGDWKNIPYEPLPKFEAWTQEKAKEEFMKRFDKWKKK